MGLEQRAGESDLAAVPRTFDRLGGTPRCAGKHPENREQKCESAGSRRPTVGPRREPPVPKR